MSITSVHQLRAGDLYSDDGGQTVWEVVRVATKPTVTLRNRATWEEITAPVGARTLAAFQPEEAELVG